MTRTMTGFALAVAMYLAGCVSKPTTAPPRLCLHQIEDPPTIAAATSEVFGRMHTWKVEGGSALVPDFITLPYRDYQLVLSVIAEQRARAAAAERKLADCTAGKH